MESKTVKQLKEIAKGYGLKTSGLKSTLIAQIAAHEAKKLLGRKESDLLLSDLPDELIVGPIMSHLEFYDFTQLVRANKRHWDLLCASIPIILTSRPLWDQEQFIAWSARCAPLEIVKPLLGHIKSTSVKRTIAIYLAGRKATDLIPTDDFKHDYERDMQSVELVRELIVAIKTSCWSLFTICIDEKFRNLSLDLKRYMATVLSMYIGPLQLVDVLHRRAGISHRSFAIFILVAYLEAERYDDYKTVVKGYSKGDYEVEIGSYVLPYITLSVYSRIAGRRIYKKDLQHGVHNRELFRSLTTEQRKWVDLEESADVAPPEELFNELLKDKTLHEMKYLAFNGSAGWHNRFKSLVRRAIKEEKKNAPPESSDSSDEDNPTQRLTTDTDSDSE